ncbi:MAG: pseudouridine-5'-phosphate glycosidase [Pyrinomonadaceae bacterium]
MIDRELFRFSHEVETALAAERAVVALESTVIAHGLPRPQNLETAERLEEIVRERGAVPATIAILDGKLCVGLNKEELRRLAESDAVRKVSRRDLPLAIAREWEGATTVASTSWIAHRAGIRVFATGGIGGVHRGDLPDVSADLPALAETPIIVVCSGAKSVLDLAATREWLETYAVTVIGYGCDEMPAFYTRRSGLAIDARVDSPAHTAIIADTHRALGTNGALLITVPVPAASEVPFDELQSALDGALKDAACAGVTGRELTPYLLSRMKELSGGATLESNIALLENNARVAADIAQALRH